MEESMRGPGRLIVIMFVLIIAAILIIFNAGGDKGTKEQKMIEPNRQSLLNADRDFYKASALNGTGKAFIDFADDSAVILRQNQYPSIGKQELAKYWLNHEYNKTPLTWEPLKAEVSPDGKLGYTLGKWTYISPNKSGAIDTTFGNYVTIWKKQSDGSWKYVLDGGGTTPGPFSIK